MSVKWIKKTTPAQVAADAPQVCVACNGSGKYDHHGSPDCAQCAGTGLEPVLYGVPRVPSDKISEETP